MLRLAPLVEADQQTLAETCRDDLCRGIVASEAKARSSKVVTTVQPAYGAVGRVIVTKDKWITEIDARMPITGGEPITRMLRAMIGTGQHSALTATDDCYRFFALLPNAIGKRVLAAAGI